MKKITLIFLVLSLFLNVGLIYKFFYAGETVSLAKDGRNEIKMTSENREYVMEEMRGFLESVQKINEGIAKNNPTIIEKIGQESGTCKVDGVPKGLIKSLPLGFKEMGFETHELFDVMAKMAKKNYDRQQTLEKLNQLLNNCVACHKTYKISVEK
mgnify:CR=1 FL=1